MRERKDFVDVRLSAAGRLHAGKGGAVRVTTAHMHYLFLGDGPVEVLRARELPLLLAERDANGEAMFEVVEVSPQDQEEEI